MPTAKTARATGKKLIAKTGRRPVERKPSRPTTSASASDLIDARIASMNDWRGQTLARVRALIAKADPAVVEECKWGGVPVWSHDGIICTGETYRKVVKMTFAKGASLPDPTGLFNSSLEGNVRRAIDIHEGENLDEKALGALIRAAVALNVASAAARKGGQSAASERKGPRAGAKPGPK